MPNLIVRDREGVDHNIKAKSGRSLMETLRDAGFDELQASCGGSCTCATCLVQIDPASFAKLPPMSEHEQDMIDGYDIDEPGSRLSCQVTLTDELDGAHITIAEEN